MELYKPDKYKVIEGLGKNVALCTCWFDPFSIESRYPEIKNNLALTGTLYSKEGVSIILRNLALNPTIRYLLLWRNTPLSKTPFGKNGSDLLLSIWSNKSRLNELHMEIDPKVLERVLKNVTLIDVSDKSFEELMKFIVSNQFSDTDAYMEPVNFPETKRDETARMESERVGWVVRDKTIYGSWLWALDRVLRYGHIRKTEYGSLQREIHNINWVIQGEDVEKIFIPDLPSDVLGAIGMSKESLEKYKESLLDPSVPEGTAYTYGSRLRAYGESKFDQVEMFIDKIKETQLSRRAAGTTLIPEYDSTQSSPPCLVFVQALADETGKLNLFAVFRSHDLFKAAIPNAYGLLNLQNYICEKVGLSRGFLSINSISAHLYEEDWDNAFKIMKCQKWEDLSTHFDEESEVDPRGIVQIHTDTNKIVIELTSLSGDVFYKDIGTTARELIMKIAKLNLLSRSDHYADICIELVKAELAVQTGAKYTQDRPFVGVNFTLK